MKKKKKLEAVMVWWVDADHEPGWSADKPSQEVELMASVGVLKHKGKNFIELSHCYGGEWLGVHRIPTGMVKRIELLREYDG